MQLSILLVTYLRFEKTLKCLESIDKYTSGEFETILTDNGSPLEMQERTKELEEKFPWLTVYLLPRSIGFCLGLKYCFERSKGKYVAYFCNDMEVTEDWNAKAIKRLESVKDAGCVGLRVIKDKHVEAFYRNVINGPLGKRFDHTLDAVSKEDKRVNVEVEADIVHDGAVIYKREALKKVEFHPRYFLSFEGLDFMMQLRQMGYKVLTSLVDVYHYPTEKASKEERYFGDKSKYVPQSEKIFYERWGIRFF